MSQIDYTLIFGLMGVVNLAHGSFYLLGGFIGFTIIGYTGNFYVALLVALLFAAFGGFIIERLFIRRVYGDLLAQCLLTAGFFFIFADIALLLSGGRSALIPLPGFLNGYLQIETFIYPANRLFVILCGFVFGTLLWQFYERTRIGALIRAGKDDMEMVGVFGIDISTIFTMTFVLGALMATFAGMVAGSFLGLWPGADLEILLLALAVVIIGGLGSLKGAFVGALLVG